MFCLLAFGVDTKKRRVDVIDTPADSKKTSTSVQIERILWAVALSMILFAFVMDSPLNILIGEWKLILHPDALITDYSAVGGFGATFFNAGIIMAASIGIVKLSHASISGPTIACVFLMSGFSMFEKTSQTSGRLFWAFICFPAFSTKTFPSMCILRCTARHCPQ